VGAAAGGSVDTCDDKTAAVLSGGSVGKTAASRALSEELNTKSKLSLSVPSFGEAEGTEREKGGGQNRRGSDAGGSDEPGRRADKTAEPGHVDGQTGELRGGGAVSLAQVLAGRVYGTLPSLAVQQRWADELIALQMDLVDCPRLRASPCLKTAWRAIAGEIPWPEVHALIGDTCAVRRDGRLAAMRDFKGDPVTPSQYYVGGLKKLFDRHEVSWDAPPRKEPPR
jgi:hypothetical protein